MSEKREKATRRDARTMLKAGMKQEDPRFQSWIKMSPRKVRRLVAHMERKATT